MKRLKLKNLIAASALSLLTMVTVLPTGASAAWKQSTDGAWNYYSEGTLTTGWQLIDNCWYLFDENGTMKTGWVNNNGSWYLLDTSGVMKTGWTQNNGSWYYLDPSTGAMKSGWLNNNNAWYYLDPSTGSMKTGLIQVNNKTYYLNNYGVMQTGNISINGQSYTFNNDGEKINSTNTTAATSSSTTNNTNSSASSTSSSSSSSSSGSSGGSGGSSSSTSTSNFSYKNLFGTWQVAKQLNSKGESQLSSTASSLAIGQKIVVSKDGIYTSLVNVSSPTFSSKTLTASDFAASYPDTFSSLGITSNTIQCVTVSGYIDGNKKEGAALVISNNKVYVYVKGALFELDRA